MLRLQNINKSYAGKAILKDVSYSFKQGSCTALIGANGAGKTTLLNIISGLEDSDSGCVIAPKGYVIGYLPQEVNHDPNKTIVEECISGAGRVFEIKLDLEKALAELEGGYTEEIYLRYEQLENLFRKEGGYALEAKAKRLLAGLGFKNEQFDLSSESLSGGLKMRIEFVQLLRREPDF